jgi:hypothetical protein
MNSNGSPDSTSEKLVYDAPRLVVEGNIRDLTLGFKHGQFLDAAFPTHTPIHHLTFS